MSAPTIIFFSVFVIPLVAFFVWLMRQDKRKGSTGIIVLAIIVAGALVWTYIKRGESKKVKIEQSGSVRPHVDSLSDSTHKGN
jgi:hypothetical protein